MPLQNKSTTLHCNLRSTGMAYLLLLTCFAMSTLKGQNARFELMPWSGIKRDFHQHRSDFKDAVYRDDDSYRNAAFHQYGINLRYNLDDRHSLSFGLARISAGYKNYSDIRYSHFRATNPDNKAIKIAARGLGVRIGYQLHLLEAGKFRFSGNLLHQFGYFHGIKVIQTAKDGKKERKYYEDISKTINEQAQSSAFGLAISYRLWNKGLLCLRPLIFFDHDALYPHVKIDNPWGVEANLGLSLLL